MSVPWLSNRTRQPRRPTDLASTARIAALEGEVAELRDRLRVMTYRASVAEKRAAEAGADRERAEAAVADQLGDVLSRDLVPRELLVQAEHRLRSLAAWCRSNGLDPTPILLSDRYGSRAP